MTLDDKLVFDLPCWDSVSQSAKDLIAQLLIKDPKQRIGLDAAMAHPWFEKARIKHQALQQISAQGSFQQKKKLSSFANRVPQ